MDNFNENLNILLEELIMAHKWQRPSILLATYKSESGLIKAQIKLEQKIRRSGQIVQYFEIDKNNFDVPLSLSKISDLCNKVFFITGLSNGGGSNNQNAFRALNMRRELLVDHAIRLVFWINPQEARMIPTIALDFWVFRHRSVEFNTRFDPRTLASLTDKLTVNLWEKTKLQRINIHHITLLDNYLAKNPQADPMRLVQIKLNFTLAGLFWLKQDFESSLKFLNKGREYLNQINNPSIEAKYWYFLGIIHDSMGFTYKAITAYQKSIFLDENMAQSWNNIGTDLMHCNLHTNALTALSKSIEINPENYLAWQYIGKIHEDTGNITNAVQAYQKSLAINKKNELTWTRLGYLYSRSGNPTESLLAYQTAKKLNNKNPETLMYLGKLYEKLGYKDKAIRTFYKAAKLIPTSTIPLIALAKLYNNNNLTKKAQKILNIAFALDPTNEEISTFLFK